MMKINTPSNYREVLFHDTAAGAFFLSGSTATGASLQPHSNGKSYPYVAIDVSSASHPLYTGQQRKSASRGRIAGFNKRFAGLSSNEKQKSRGHGFLN
jgi:large subunit ribosomal protein L31